MNINGIGSVPGAAAGGVGQTPGNDMGQEQFLELLLVQMQNQSPLDPMDSQQFLAQLAQFSTLEQLAGVNAGIDNLAMGQAGVVAGQVVTMIGKDVTYEGNEVQLADGEANLKFELDQTAASVRVSIRNEDGTVIRVVDLGNRSSGVNEYVWDGEDDAGNAQPPGTYTFEVEATNQAGDDIRSKTFSTGRVDGVTYANGTPELIIGEIRKNPADILQITERQEPDEQ
jgi:flagellar basal-body rod modification protein FlgD